MRWAACTGGGGMRCSVSWEPDLELGFLTFSVSWASVVDCVKPASFSD